MVRRTHLFVGVLAVTSLIITGCESIRETTLERNKELVRLVNDEIWNKGNLEMMDELYSADVIRHFLPDGSKIEPSLNGNR